MFPTWLASWFCQKASSNYLPSGGGITPTLSGSGVGSAGMSRNRGGGPCQLTRQQYALTIYKVTGHSPYWRNFDSDFPKQYPGCPYQLAGARMNSGFCPAVRRHPDRWPVCAGAGTEHLACVLITEECCSFMKNWHNRGHTEQRSGPQTR